jgi:GrpB-like predicted nucleotidyltransferase (UPF0157 family)
VTTLPRAITVAPYDPRWPAAFESERDRVLAVCLLIRAIEHIGSTSVLGLAAKAVIDIMPGVASLADTDACVGPIKALGYEYVPQFQDELPERRFFRRDTDGARSHHIHLVVEGGEFWERHPLFRDYLRSHPETAQAYAALKRELAAQYYDMNDYAEAKGDFVRGIEAQARAE